MNLRMQCKLPTSSFTHGLRLSGNYSYRVKACFNSNKLPYCGPWSAVSNTIINTTKYLTPKNVIAVIENTKHKINWDSVSDNTIDDIDYDIAVSIDFTDQIILDKTSVNSHLYSPKTSGHHRYSIRGCSTDLNIRSCDQWSMFSNALSTLDKKIINIKTELLGTPANY